MPIEGATAPEEGGKGSELGELERSVASWSYSEGGGTEGTHLPHASRHWQPRIDPHNDFLLGQAVGQYKVGLAKASDAIPKKIAKQSIKAAISFTNLYNP